MSAPGGTGIPSSLHAGGRAFKDIYKIPVLFNLRTGFQDIKILGMYL
jgi:hypothetical protein